MRLVQSRMNSPGSRLWDRHWHREDQLRALLEAMNVERSKIGQKERLACDEFSTYASTDSMGNSETGVVLQNNPKLVTRHILYTPLLIRHQKQAASGRGHDLGSGKSPDDSVPKEGWQVKSVCQQHFIQPGEYILQLWRAYESAYQIGLEFCSEGVGKMTRGMDVVTGKRLLKWWIIMSKLNT